MNLFPFMGRGEFRARLQKKRKSIRIRLNPGMNHSDEENQCQNRRRTHRKPSNHGIPNEQIGLFDRIEQRDGIRDVTEARNGGKLDELAEGELGVVEASLDDLSVDLSESSNALASGEKFERWVVLKELVRRIGRGKDMEGGGGGGRKYT